MKTIIHQLKIAWGFASGAVFASMTWTLSLEDNWLCALAFFVSMMAFYFAIREHDKNGCKGRES